MDTINNTILMCTSSPSSSTDNNYNKTYDYSNSSSNKKYDDASELIPYISPFRFYTQSSTRFSNDGTFDVKYDVIFSSSVTSSRAARNE
jgi:hypothetical protein